ncbi:Hypothetical protein PHPALM_5928 [Phytophthora palmivora]|uniref:peptidylprolyl isomerase n=1 Tax=Phytophthora palmivora TaxID=4796 RepID=A0A2P4YG72_9STRA|nr:Hypothetical protein PHPALM_5928 [Phytophthora palmivora]
MSSASYAAWAKFDVEKELERVDENEQLEAQQKQKLKLIRAKESVETSATHAAQQSADILAAQAAVAALKAKKTRKGRGKTSHATGDEKVRKLQTQAALFETKHQLLQEIMENRRLGDKLLARDENWKEAQVHFERALNAVEKLKELAPELLNMEEEQTKLIGKEAKQQDSKQQQVCKQEGEHSCGKSCGHEESKKLDELLPKANDLMAIIKMFYKDVYMGIGSCELERGHLAAATEAFKEVLLRDDAHLMAWLNRGKAFERMKAPLLAMLHYNRITNLDSEHEKGKESLERVKTKLLADGDASSDKSTIQLAVLACTEDQTFKQSLERIQWVFEEANVLAVESFFDYSTTKYQIVLGCLEVVRTRQEWGSIMEDSVFPVLREIEISCHLNIAGGYLEMQRNYTKGLSHCEQAFRLDSNRSSTHFRMGQLFHALHNYEKALKCFETAKALVPAAVSEKADEQRKKMLTSIVKEVDKCEFDRRQYDAGYLRSLAAK